MSFMIFPGLSNSPAWGTLPLDEEAPAKGKTATQAGKAVTAFLGGHWGGALAISNVLLQHKGDGATEAKVVDGKIIVTKRENTGIRLMLESHYFFTVEGIFCDGECGLGPFVAFEPNGGGNNLINAMAFGLLWGVKAGDSGSFNIGIGVNMEPKAK
jgi:hypothetical protein